MKAWCEAHASACNPTQRRRRLRFSRFLFCDGRLCSVRIPQLACRASSVGKHPGNDFYPRQLVRSARQFAMDAAWSRPSDGADGRGRQRILAYLLSVGENGHHPNSSTRSQYRLKQKKKGRCHPRWPPSQPFHLTWGGAIRMCWKRGRGKTGVQAARRSTPSCLQHRGIMTV